MGGRGRRLGRPLRRGRARRAPATRVPVARGDRAVAVRRITVHSPLRRWSATSGHNVAIVATGGLGHLGVKIAHAMGAEVTALSSPPRTREDGLRFGGSHDADTGPEDARGTRALASSHRLDPLDAGRARSLPRSLGTRWRIDQCRPARGPDLRRHGGSWPSRDRGVRLEDRRHTRNPGESRVLRHLRHRCRGRGDRYRSSMTKAQRTYLATTRS